MHFHLTSIETLIGAVCLIVAVALTAAFMREKRRRDKASFRNYFWANYDRSYSRQGYSGDSEE